MQLCPNCSHRNRPGVIFCENCGASLIGKAPLSTRSIGTKALPPAADEVSASIATAGTDVFKPGMLLRMEVEGAEPILLEPKQETIFGRRDPATGGMPDVDLTPFAGYRMGVSRRHASIKLTDDNHLDLWDLGSSNGTFLNGTRLPAHKPHTIHDGDEIRFGQMVMRVYFQMMPKGGKVTNGTTTANN